jgi:molecular chaperone GrpE
MPEKRPKLTGAEEDTSIPGNLETEPESDAIEILEVVGVDEDGKAIPSDGAEAGAEPARADPPPATPEPGTPGDSIPYSREELYDLLLRKQAEFENARKRLEREREEVRRRVGADLAKQLLPVLDNLDRALAEPAAGKPTDGLRRGVELVSQQIGEVLSREGLEPIAAVGERFDPNLHEAVETRVVPGFEEGVVLEELRKGYLFRGQLLRPALVRVSAKGGAGAGEAES